MTLRLFLICCHARWLTFEREENESFDVLGMTNTTPLNATLKSDKFNQNERILIDYLEDFGKRFSSIDKDFLRTLREMLAFDPSKRITIRELFAWMVNNFCH